MPIAMPCRYEVRHHTLCDGWVNTWLLDDQPHTFASKAEAQAALDEFLAEIAYEIETGEREPEHGYDPSEYRIVRIGETECVVGGGT